MKLRFLVLPVLLVLMVPCAYAGQIKIVDQRGLTRAVRKVPDKARVIIKVNTATENASEITLSNIDGMGGDVAGRAGESTQIVFENISEGTWEIRGAKKVAVSEVKIVD